jgi:hypothetical protein
MHTYLHPDPLAYTGPQLSSHFIYRTFGLRGDAIAAFAGPCQVSTQEMVDLEDVHAGLHIYSEHMLHILVEHFEAPLRMMVLRQRLLTAQIQQVLQQHGVGALRRRGDDLYDQAAKLSVSIATVSPVSGLIHFGLNISSRNTPVPTRGLSDYGIDWQIFATQVLEAYAQEEQSMTQAVAKVRWVS